MKHERQIRAPYLRDVDGLSATVLQLIDDDESGERRITFRERLLIQRSIRLSKQIISAARQVYEDRQGATSQDRQREYRIAWQTSQRARRLAADRRSPATSAATLAPARLTA
jgi:hypothetical protein